MNNKIFVADLHEVVQVLLDNGADVLATGNVHFSNWLHWIPYSYPGQSFVTHLMSSKGGFGAGGDIFPLIAALCDFYREEDSLMILKMLLSAGANINQRTAIGQTVLHVLATFCYKDVYRDEFILDGDFNDDQLDLQSKTALFLIDNGADVNICDYYGRSPLHYAVSVGKRHLTRILLEKGADVYLKDKFGMTALEYAAMHDHALTKALIDKYDFPIEQIIDAYECAATHSASPLELLQKATLLRKEHGIPKTVLPPEGCYGFIKEWETMKELERPLF